VRRDDILKLAVLLALVAALLTAYVRIEKAPLAGDVWTATHVQRFDALHANEGLINAFAPWSWVIALGAALLLVVRRKLPAGTPGPVQRQQALAMLIGGLLLSFGSDLLKRMTTSPRPSAAFGIQIDQAFGGYGFPSGHVYRDVVFYGLLALVAPMYLSPRLAIAMRIACIAIILLAGPARIVIGAHWPSDVLGGYLWGGAAVALAAWFGRWAVKHE
jgi:membrane-associated phospholipid phosphatase